MELKLMFDSKSAIGCEIIHMGRLCSSSVVKFKEVFGVRFSHPQLCSCKGLGAFAKSSNWRTANNAHKPNGAVGSVAHGNSVIDSYSYYINGRHGVKTSLYPRKPRILDACDDEYGGVMVKPDNLPSDPSAFGLMLSSSLSHWKRKGKKGVWLKLPLERSELVPIAVKEGFEYHHAERGYVMLTFWIPDGPSLLPANASHQVGVGGFVINDDNEVLVVQERYRSPASAGLWKLPTGFILESEEIFSGAVREVKEETGVDTEFIEVIAFRHAHNVAFEKSDLFFVCMLRPISTQIMVDDHEIEAAKWMPLIEFVEQPLIQEDKMFKKIIDICIARLGERYCGLSAHQLISKFDGKESTLYFNVVDSGDSSCPASSDYN